jgi:hypothetical protein
MVRHPLHRGVGEDHVEAVFAVGPIRDVAGQPLPAGMQASRPRDHFGGTIEPGQFGPGPARGQHLGAISRSAPEVDHPARIFEGDARRQIAARLGALRGES